MVSTLPSLVTKMMMMVLPILIVMMVSRIIKGTSVIDLVYQINIQVSAHVTPDTSIILMRVMMAVFL